MTWKPDVILYHASCLDGFGGAFAAWFKWGSEGIDYIPCSYGEPAPLERCTGKNVLIVDFSFKRDAMAELGRVVKSCIVLDHHASAEKELEPWASRHLPAAYGKYLEISDVDLDQPVVAIFDMEKSGARMAWEFCHPGEPIPTLIEHIEDRDLWRKALDGTDEIYAALQSYPLDFELWEGFAEFTGELKAEGQSILRAHRKNVAAFCKNAYFEEIGGHRVPCLNVNYPYVSDCGHELLQLYLDAPFAACWSRSGGNITYSLRSENGRADVSEIARNYGGGGHVHASGFELCAADGNECGLWCPKCGAHLR